MMICVAFIGGGAVDSVVSVLCGAGGGLTVHDPTSSTQDSMPTTVDTRRVFVGTVFRLTTTRT